MHRTTVALSVSAALTALPVLSHALALGEGTVRSRAGAPFEATLAVYAAPAERARPWTISVLPDLFSRDRGALAGVLGDIVAEVEHGRDGDSWIRLRGTMPLPVASVTFRVRVASGALAQVRRYAFSPPPPQAPRLRRAPRRTPPPAAAANEAAVWTVAAGDTLWDIARSLARPEGLAVTMSALHATNPHAFVNGDIDRLKVGAELRLRADAATGERSPPRVAPASQTAASMPVPVESVPRATPAPSTPGPRAPARRAEAPATTTPDPALAARLAELDAKFAAIRARYAPAGATDATPGAAVPDAAAALPPVDELLAESETMPEPAPRTEISPAVDAPPAAQALPARAKPPLQQAAPSPVEEGSNAFALAMVGVAAALLAGAVGLAVRRRQRRRARQAAWSAREAARRAEVAEKAGRHQPAAAARRSHHGIESSESLSPPPGALSPEPKVTTVAVGPSDHGTDLSAEIDVNIAYGRYAEAESQLQEVIASTTRNVGARMRLAEIYYITERVAEFTALVDELQGQYRAELADEDWRRLVRMGRVIAPGHPTFAGPRAVNQS